MKYILESMLTCKRLYGSEYYIVNLCFLNSFNYFLQAFLKIEFSETVKLLQTLNEK